MSLLIPGFLHNTVRGWQERLHPRFAQELRANLQSHVGKLGFIDETDGKGKDQWCDLYLANTAADCWRRCPAFKLDYIA